MEARRLGWARLAWAMAVVIGVLAGVRPAGAQEFGRVVGRAMATETSASLEGGRVTVVGTSLSAVTDASGRYALARVPVGPQTLHFSYIGRTPQSVGVTVLAGATVTADFSAPITVTQLEEMTVVGNLALTQAEALNRQKNAANIVNIVASDQIGRFPDASAPEAVQRLPGVAVSRDQGEGRYIQIRGGSPANTQVTFNGVEVPAPEGEVRQIALDAVPVDVLGSIEVTKALLPWQDANAIGGSVNLVTRETPMTRTFSGEVSGGYGSIRDEAAWGGMLTYGDRPGAGKFGFLLSGSYTTRDFGSDDVEPAYDLGDPGQGDDVMEAMDSRYYTLNRTRYGGTALLDFRPSTSTTFALSGIYSRLEDDEQRQVLVNEVADGELIWEHRNRYEYQEIFGLSLFGDHQLQRGGVLDWQLGFTEGAEHQPYEMTGAFVQEGVAFAPVLDEDEPRANPADGTLGGTYLFDEFENTFYDTKNEDWTGAANLALPFGLGATGTGRFRFGAKVRAKTKNQANTTLGYELADGAPDIVLGTDVGGPFDKSLENPDTYALPPFGTSPDDIRHFTDTFGSSLEEELVLEEETNDYDLDETVVAGYAAAEINLTPDLMLLPGIRYEYTSLNTSGKQWDSEAETLTPVDADNNYGNVFPYLHARYAFTPQTNLRAAFTTAIARANFFELVPYILRDGEDVALGNPDLDPTTSWNLDLMLEHYDNRIGVMSAGVFYKSISDPIFLFTEDNAFGGETEQPGNGDSGHIVGIELAFQQQLRFLPGALSGFGVYANYTYTDSEAKLPGGRTATFQGQAKHVANAALSYEMGGFSAQFSTNYYDDFLLEYGGDTGDPEEEEEDVWTASHLQLDFLTSYRFANRMTLFLELNNLSNAPLRVFQGVRPRPIQLEYYERWGRIGFRITR